MHSINENVGFIGGGQMGEAIIGGLILSELCSTGNIYVMDILDSCLEHIKEKFLINHVYNSRNTSYNFLVENCKIIILAVKPQVMKEVLERLRDAPWDSNHTIISIVGGVKTTVIEKYLTKVPVVRVIPNTPMLVNEGVSGVALGKNAQEKDGELALRIFKSLGTVYLVPEHMIDAITSVSGCGPAYVYMFIEAMADGGVEMGLPRCMAQELAAQTVLGAARMVLETGEHPGVLKDKVCSPGGATIAGVRAIEQDGFRGIVMHAVEAGKIRMEKVGEKAGQ